jgi:DNA-directed RNA polymerase III subunit RPC2
MVVDEESDWDLLNRTNWRGLGLTDPIKSVEVRFMPSR